MSTHPRLPRPGTVAGAPMLAKMVAFCAPHHVFCLTLGPPCSVFIPFCVNHRGLEDAKLRGAGLLRVCVGRCQEARRRVCALDIGSPIDPVTVFVRPWSSFP
jgi:hypothetical protein